MKPTVSVVMISYNHEQYIEEAISSILNQECSFEFELVISDDKSPDKTSSVIEKMISSHPNGGRIRFFPQDPNLGMMQNFSFVLQEAKGDFIAICEGDDYWTDNQKLQKQYDILKANQDCVLSFHNTTILYQNDQSTKAFNDYQQSFYTSDELFDQWLIPTASSFFRNVIPENLPDFLQKGTHGDLALFLLLGESGKFHCLDETMSVYRINDGGVMQQGFKGIKHNLGHIAQLDDMLDYFGEKHKAALKQRKSMYLLSNAQLYVGQKEKNEAKKALRAALHLNPSLRWSKASVIIRIFVKIIFG